MTRGREDLQDALERDGWVLLPSIVPPELVARLAAELEAAYVQQRAIQIRNGVALGTDGTVDGEVGLFNTCDIGVYSLLDDEWSKGKCGFKAIEFMACGVPVVAAAIGANREIIKDGLNGFLASTDDEWVEKLGQLLVDRKLGRRLGAAGRRTVEELTEMLSVAVA